MNPVPQQISHFAIPFFGTALGVLFASQILCYIYNIYFHPLRRFPGPRTWAASRIPHEWHFSRGNIVKVLSELHVQYGEVVRVSPTYLSFIHPDAWNDIYNRKSGDPRHLDKDPKRYPKVMWINGHPELFTAPEDIHSRLRRVLLPAFSKKAVAAQEGLVNSNVDRLISGIKELVHEKKQVNITQWMNWTMFDIIGDLAFGEDFGCLRNRKPHPWVTMIFETVKIVSFMSAIRQFDWANRVLDTLAGPIIKKNLDEQAKLTIAKVDRRLAKEDMFRGDFLSEILKQSGTSKEWSRGEMYSNLNLLIMAGSETSSAAVTGCLYFLVKNPDIRQKLLELIRAKCASKKDINFANLSSIPYFEAVLNESMRLYPPQPIFTPRIVSRPGIRIAGYPIPEGTTVGIYQTVAYHSKENFAEPESFDPTRWLGNPKYSRDRKDVYQPFSVGPHNCIAQGLAYNEMRLIVARVLWEYDLSIIDEDGNWLSTQKAFWSWGRGPLMMGLKERDQRA